MAPSYNLRDLSAPTLSGLPQKLFTYTLELPYAGLPLRQYILSKSGFSAFRAQHPPSHPPTPVHPLHPHPAVPSPSPSLSRIQSLLVSLDERNHEDPLPSRPTIRHFWTAYEHGRLTPLQVAHALIHAVQTQHAQSLNAILHLDVPLLLQDARASTARWSKACPKSFLDGIPFTVKDCLDAAPFPTGNASGHISPRPPHLDADAVKALRDAGMLLLGKSRMDELGLGVRGHSVYTGQIRNPHNLSRVSGGSSGGDAAAVAAGLVPVALATDAGGSVRIPAACCGVFGIKPTYGAISPHGRALQTEDSHPPVAMHVGILAACPQDLAVLYYVLAGFAPQRVDGFADVGWDGWRAGGVAAPRRIETDVGGLRVGVFEEWNASADAAVRAVCERFLRAVCVAGATVERVFVPELEEVRVSLAIALMREVIWTGERTGAFGKGNMAGVGFDARAKMAVSREFDERDFGRACATRGRAIREAGRLFEEVDVIVTPALACLTPLVPVNEKDGVSDAGLDSRLMRFMCYGNLTGLPACAIPVEKVDGMPVAVQVIAAPWCEEMLLRFCLWAEKEFNVSQCMQPSTFYNALG